MRTIIYGNRRISPYEGANKEQRSLISQANKLLREHKLLKKLAKKEKRVSS